MPLSNKQAQALETAGTWCIRVSAVFLLFLFLPVLYQEVRYFIFSASKSLKEPLTLWQSPAEKKEAKRQNIPTPIDTAFGIVIPKIGANSRVLADIDWQDSTVYQKALTQGVAHARGSAKPGEQGNTFLFAHAGASPIEALRYNAVFYLLDKLETEDMVEVWYQNKRFTYQVTNKKIVGADEVQYVEGATGVEQLTLMTCWPAGTTLRRLIVQAELVQSNSK